MQESCLIFKRNHRQLSPSMQKLNHTLLLCDYYYYYYNNNLLQPPLHQSVIESLFEINHLVLSGRVGVTIFRTQSIDCCRHFSFATENRYINTSNLTPMLTTPNQFMHNMSKIKTNIPARGTATHVKTIHLRWLNTVFMAVSEYMSFAQSWREKGCSSQAETWQVKNILLKDLD